MHLGYATNTWVLEQIPSCQDTPTQTQQWILYFEHISIRAGYALAQETLSHGCGLSTRLIRLQDHRDLIMVQKQSWSLCSTRLPSADEWEAELDLCSNVKNSRKSPSGSSTIKDNARKVRAKCIPQVPPIKATKGSRSAERIRAIERAKKEVELSSNCKELIAKMLAWQPIVEP